MKTRYPAAGAVLGGKYRIERLIGEGGMGAVARAQHLLTRAPCALKFMNPEYMQVPGAVERFLKEGQAAARIRSDHVVQIFDVDKLPEGAPYIAMECLEGSDLDGILLREGKGGIDVARAVHLTVQILRALQAAHGVGIVHRDIKPGNCFVLTKDGEVDFVKLLDFGISKVTQPGQVSLTQTNTALGTPLYMSPEQASTPKDVDLRSDLYSVGVILFELLTGATPFASESGELTELLFKIFTADAPSPRVRRPELPEELAQCVLRALTRKVDERFQTALEFVDALAPFADARSAVYIARVRAYVPPDLVEDTWAVAPMTAFSDLQGRSTEPPEDLLEATNVDDGNGPLRTVALAAARVPDDLHDSLANIDAAAPGPRSHHVAASVTELSPGSIRNPARAFSETGSLEALSVTPNARSARGPWMLVAGAGALVAALGLALALRPAATPDVARTALGSANAKAASAALATTTSSVPTAAPPATSELALTAQVAATVSAPASTPIKLGRPTPVPAGIAPGTATLTATAAPTTSAGKATSSTKDALNKRIE